MSKDGVLKTLDSEDGPHVFPTSTKGRLNVNALNDDALVRAAMEGRAFIWSTNHTAGMNEHVLYLRNISTKDVLHIVSVSAGGSKTSIVALYSVDANGSGADSVEFNMNFSGNAAQAVHLQNDVGEVGALELIGNTIISAYAASTFKLNRALILGQNDALTVFFEDGGPDTVANITGYFEPI